MVILKGLGGASCPLGFGALVDFTQKMQSPCPSELLTPNAPPISPASRAIRGEPQDCPWQDTSQEGEDPAG